MAKNRGSGGNLSGRSDWEQEEVDRQQALGEQQGIPHRTPGPCKDYKEHRLAKVGTVEIGGVPLNRIECNQPGCGFKTTEPFGKDG